ncbi:MAG: hypothetical protein ACSLEL_00740 [Candidatus Malihini olakiniferum]
MDSEVLMASFRDEAKEINLPADIQSQFLDEFKSGLYGDTYLEDA